MLAETGLTPCVVGAMAPGRDLVDAARAVADTQDYLRACIDFAAGIGARSVCGPFYASTGRVWRMDADQRQTAYDDLRTHLAPVVDHAVAQGVRLGIEPLNRYETSLVNTVDQALTALEPLLGEGLGPGPGQLPPQHRGAVQRRRDPSRRSSTWRTSRSAAATVARPGGDQTDWKALVYALDDVGYDGPLVIESFTADNASIATAASIWRPLARHPGRARPRRACPSSGPRLSDRPPQVRRST